MAYLQTTKTFHVSQKELIDTNDQAQNNVFTELPQIQKSWEPENHLLQF